VLYVVKQQQIALQNNFCSKDIRLVKFGLCAQYDSKEVTGTNGNFKLAFMLSYHQSSSQKSVFVHEFFWRVVSEGSGYFNGNTTVNNFVLIKG